MDKNVFQNTWFIRIASLFFAIFLYIFVSSETASVPIHVIKNQEYASVNVTETISNVPVYLGKTDPETFVSGVPEAVDVRLTGPKNIINQVTSETIRVETEDLRNVQTGSKAIRYLVTNLPEDVDYQVTPSRTIVQISHRKTVNVPVSYEVDPGAIDSKFEVVDVKINPQEVTLTGNDQIIDDVDQVFIKILSNEANKENFKGTYPIQIVDKDGNLLDVNASSSDIEVEVIVAPKGQTAKVSLNAVGENRANFNYTYEFETTNEVKIRSLHRIPAVEGTVDVSGLTTDTSLPVKVNLPKGVKFIGEQLLSVYVRIIPVENSQESPTDNSGDPQDEIEQVESESENDSESTEATQIQE